ncbi:MAG: Ig-like domain-containing protein [Pseudomonadota bacterium]
MATLKITNISSDTGIAGDGITNDNKLVIHGTAAISGSLDVYLDGVKIGVANTAGQNGLGWQFDYSATAIADGQHVFTVVSNGVSVTYGVTIDTHVDAPSVALTNDTGISSSDAITSADQLTLGGVEQGAAVAYSADHGVSWTSAFHAVEGANSVQVRQTDLAGNVSAASTLDFSYDSIAPAAAALALVVDSGASDSDAYTNNGAVTAGGTEDGARLEYSVNGGAWSSDDSAVEGSNHVQVRQIDVAGNVGAASALDFTLDTVAPAALALSLANDSGSSQSDNVSNDGQLAVSAGEDGARVEYSADGSNWSEGFTAVEGANSVQVRQIDRAGNVGAPASLDFTLDTTAPDAPQIALAQDSGSSDSDAITNNGAIVVTPTEADASVEYSSNGSNWSASFAAAEGANSVMARQVDRAGNAGAPATLNFTLDTVAPGAPALALVQDSGSSHSDGITNNGAIVASGTENGATVQYSANGGDWSASFSALEGANSVQARQIDVAGNIGALGSLSFTLDTVAPNAPTIVLLTDTGSSSTDHITSNGAIVVGGMEAGASAAYSIDGGANWSASFAATEGANAVLVRQSDNAGNLSATSSLNFTLDTIAQAAVMKAASLNGNSATMSLAGTSEANSVVTIFDLSTGKVSGTAVAGATGAWSFTTAKVSGIHSFSLSEKDVAGNVGASSQQAFIGTMGVDRIVDVAGQNDILSGAQGTDTFVFAANFGNDVITDFIAGNGTHELIQFSKASFASFADMMSHTSQVGTSAIITDGHGDSVTLVGVNIGDLKVVDFTFV